MDNTIRISNRQDENGVLTFNISGTDVSYVNALRRIALTEIPIVAFKTFPYEEFKDHIFVNTSRLTNEIIGQRLSCIPICLKQFPELLENHKDYLLEVDVENNTDTTMVVTTKDFKIKNVKTNTYLDDSYLIKLFPPFIGPDDGKEYYIDFVRLRPKLSERLPGEKIRLKCAMKVGKHKENGMFNIVSTCSYGCTPDMKTMRSVVETLKKKWKDEGKTAEEVEYEAKNWVLLDGMREYKIPGSFDFIIQSVGIYENEEIILMICDVLRNKFRDLLTMLTKDEISIFESQTTIANSYDVTLENEDYTIGNIINYEIYKNLYFENKVSYVGFKKMHPHDTSSLLRVSFVSEADGIPQLKQYLKTLIELSIEKIGDIKSYFVPKK